MCREQGSCASFSVSASEMSPAEIMRRIKGRTSRKLFEEFPHLKRRYWGRHFWARGYFCVTAGELTRQMIDEYLEHEWHLNKLQAPQSGPSAI